MALLAHEVDSDLAEVGSPAVFEKIDALPCSERGHGRRNGDGELDLG